MSRMREMLEAAENIRPMAKKNGKNVVTFEEAAILSNAEGIEPTPDTGIRHYNSDGSIASIRTKNVAINPNSYFANRYKVKGKPGNQKMYVVVDWRAIQEQQRGNVYLKNIPCYVFVRDEMKQLQIEKIEMVSDTEFVSDFTNILDNASMAELVPLIANFGTDGTTSALPI